jgi:peptide/nickel transport system substrate-binding protein
MNSQRRRKPNVNPASIFSAAALAVFVSYAWTAKPVHAAGTVTVAVTSDFVSRSPYGDSTAQMYGIWCQIYGCLGVYDTQNRTLRGLLAEKWEIDPEDPKSWIITLRKGLKRHKDGRELKAEDVVHSIWRVKNDRASRQGPTFSDIAGAEVIDDHRVRISSRAVSAILPIETFDQLIITAKDLYDKHGGEKSDRDFPLGWGPYELRQNLIGQRMVLDKNKNWPDIKAANPDRLIFVRIPEAEAQLTALHNGEVQIASVIPPHMLDRLKSRAGFEASIVPSAEGFFLGMNQKFSPWTQKAARQAVAHAINKEQIIDKIYLGQAKILHGPVGEDQYGYDPKLHPRYHYDPDRARAILKEAGLVGTEINFTTTTNRFLYDIKAAEAIAPMLQAVGFKVTLTTPEYATQFASVQRGERPFYMHSRGNMMDPTAAITQMFETGASHRIRYANPAFDKALSISRTAVDPEKRFVLLREALAILEEDVPAVWLWKANNIYGIDANKVQFVPTPHNRVSGTAISVK